MKKTILILSLIVTFCGIFIAASPYLLNITGLDEPVKKYIFSKLIDDSQGRLDIQKFKIGLGKIHLSDVAIESETAKIVENSYRATILAFMNEWSIFSERNGVDLIKVINAIGLREKRPLMKKGEYGCAIAIFNDLACFTLQRPVQDRQGVFIDIKDVG